MATNTDKYKFNHTMLRVKDPEKSIKFYDFLGMKVIQKLSFPDAKFDLYFLAYDTVGAVSAGKDWTDREGIIELTHNYGTEHDDGFKVSNGNSDPYKGFGHVCISVDFLQAACQRIEAEGYKFQKRYDEGRMKRLAFVLDPDGYWVEIIAKHEVSESENVKETDVTKYNMNHTMLRVKDIKKSLDFYQDVLGMTLTRNVDLNDAGFSLYFLAYTGGQPLPEYSGKGIHPNYYREGLLELTHNHGSETDDTIKYHNGNDEPQGFGHICIAVDDIDAACQRFEDLRVRWKKRLTDGRMKEVAFLLDPDNYWVEVIQNKALKHSSLGH